MGMIHGNNNMAPARNFLKQRAVLLLHPGERVGEKNNGKAGAGT
jgi:hypothetical protein